MKRFWILISVLSFTFVSLDVHAQKDSTNDKVQKQSEKAMENARKMVGKTPAMINAGDSLAYTFGVAQSNGLSNFIVTQLGVDTAYIDQFTKGVMDRVKTNKDDKARYAYIQGLQIGNQIEQMAKGFANDYYGANSESSVSSSIVATGVMQGLLGISTTTPDEAGTEFRTRLNEHKYGKTKEEGEQFLATNRTKPGVKETASGLQYKILTQGDGPIPTANQKVKVNYEGHLIDGTEFDSSYKRGEPAVFGVGQVIKGWTEALCLMPVGSKYELYIPQNLAYGERAAGSIPPYSTLIFTVELISIEQ